MDIKQNSLIPTRDTNSNLIMPTEYPIKLFLNKNCEIKTPPISTERNISREKPKLTQNILSKNIIEKIFYSSENESSRKIKKKPHSTKCVVKSVKDKKNRGNNFFKFQFQNLR